MASKIERLPELKIITTRHRLIPTGIDDRYMEVGNPTEVQNPTDRPAASEQPAANTEPQPPTDAPATTGPGQA